jgi:hypothetical protein
LGEIERERGMMEIQGICRDSVDVSRRISERTPGVSSKKKEPSEKRSTPLNGPTSCHASLSLDNTLHDIKQQLLIRFYPPVSKVEEDYLPNLPPLQNSFVDLQFLRQFFPPDLAFLISRSYDHPDILGEFPYIPDMVKVGVRKSDRVDGLGLDGRRLGAEGVESGEGGLAVEVEGGLAKS